MKFPADASAANCAQIEAYRCASATFRINVALEEYQELEGELPYDGTAELWWDSLEEMQEDFASEEAATAVADADTFTVVRTHIYTREFVLR